MALSFSLVPDGHDYILVFFGFETKKKKRNRSLTQLLFLCFLFKGNEVSLPLFYVDGSFCEVIYCF